VSDFEERLEALRHAFRRRAAEEHGRLVETLAAGDFEAVRTIAHSLAGAGGVFGFPEISEAAGAVEDADDERIRAIAEPLLNLLNYTARSP